MGLMDKLSNSMSQTAKSFTKLSANMVEISKLNLSIKKREEEIQQKLEEIGQYVYSRFKKMSMVSRAEVQDLILEIKVLEEDINTLEKLILNLKRLNYCEGCQLELDEDARYCPICGKLLRH
ncbi:zinc ribbon domain-containing protein [Alkaliphilus peptidifermentans]|uniref:Zinc-ribbon domain-containing protein n=1 Tax=Alkaliphilus peptidifermentans DSM 18978 TaxID=1120976 RepID=A0A1G5I0K2_9FIRM|nr:hypothetical protein [Alkaliphilus peptidifermentans]SCY69249.1 hypothetical protein SAMN03080606_02175 [Alkaliphilus peptidifermentans DSM 18978]